MTHCDTCDEMHYAWRNVKLTYAELCEIVDHLRECEVARAEAKKATAQIDALDAKESE